MEYHYVHTLILNSLRWYNCISPLCEYDSYVVGLITEIRNGVSIRKKYSHARECCFRVYLASKFGTWVTVDDSARDITAFLSRHCLVRIQPGTAFGSFGSFGFFGFFGDLALSFLLRSASFFLKFNSQSGSSFLSVAG